MNSLSILAQFIIHLFSYLSVLFQFSNLLGTVYNRGDIVFSNDGNTVICPVGNKISVYDLRNNKSYTLPIEAKYNYKALALSPNGVILLASVYRKYSFIFLFNVSVRLTSILLCPLCFMHLVKIYILYRKFCQLISFLWCCRKLIFRLYCTILSIIFIVLCIFVSIVMYVSLVHKLFWQLNV